MKIKNLELKNYKRFVNEKTVSFCDTDGKINDLTLIAGNNGTGKSSLLQAIVALIAPLTRDRFDVSKIDWSGFEYRFIQSGRMPLRLRAAIEFSECEIAETINFANRLNELGNTIPLPDRNREISIEFDYARKDSRPETAGNAFQFRGHGLAKQLAKFESNKSKLFERVGNIYWYTEQRTSYNINEVFEEEMPRIDSIRTFLSNAYSFHLAITDRNRELQKGEFDFYAKLSELYSTVFTDRKFIGSAPHFELFEKNPVPDFFLTDGQNQYELSELSAGERAIFPILMDFARYNINNSIIIIDEIELHLHAPLQQALVRALPKLGHDNQFILTTHSDTVSNMFDESENQIIRLK
jgi:predicted ATP-dependent endonuclease of OLD family